MNAHSPIPEQEPSYPPAYLTGHLRQTPEGMAGQLRHLAKIGLAANDSNLNIEHMDASFEALFEVMHRLAFDLETELGKVRGAFE